jgi:ribonuclease Z
MKVTILGSSSATPIYDRHPSSQLLTVNDQHYLIDCGEGTLFRLNDFKIKKNKIRAIYISHLHGDHFYGLIGLLTTMSMHERSDELTIVSPSRLKDIIDLQCEISKTKIRFPIRYIEFEEEHTLIYSDNNISVHTIPLIHKITTCGFRFDQVYPEFRISKEKLKSYNLTPSEVQKLVHSDQIITENGDKIILSDITIQNTESKSYAYCSDTEVSDSYLKYIENLDLLYHESTFLQKEKTRAIETKHSTAMEAGIVAKKVNAKRLIIGHFSARYLELNPLLEEAKSEFEHTELALEGLSFEI